MHIQTCSQCGAKNQIDDEAGQGGRPVCAQCGAELSTVATLQSEQSGLERNDSGLAGNRSPALMRRLPDALVSYSLIAVNVLVFVLMLASGAHPFEPTTESIYSWGADFGPASLGAEPWRLLSSMFVHIGIIHLALNMYVLSNVGPLTEGLFGKIGFLALYLLSGIGGSLVSLYWNPAIVSAGASGAVFGLFGGLLGLLMMRKSSLPSDFVQGHMTSIIGFIGFNVFYGMTVAGINNAAHLGGLATGFILALVLRPDPTGVQTTGKIARFAGIMLVLLAMGLVGFAARRRVEGSREARFRSIELSTAKVVAQPGKEVHFLNQASRDEAQSLAQFLQAEGLFKEAGEIIILLSKDARGFDVSLSLRPEDVKDPKALKYWEVKATDMSVDIFNKQHVAVHLCDEFLVPVSTVKSGSKILMGGKKSIYFRDDVTENEAQGLSRTLQEMKFGEGAEDAYIELSKNSQGYELVFLVKDGTWDNQGYIAWFERLANDLSVNVFNKQPVAIHMADGEFTIKRTIKNQTPAG